MKKARSQLVEKKTTIASGRRRWIVADAEHLGGAPRVRDTRISVALLLELLSTGMSVGEIAEAYPSLSVTAIRGTLRELSRSDNLSVA